MLTRINRAVTARRDGRLNDKGFTLIELLVVVIIIGILAAIAIPMFLNQREAAWRSSVESDLKNAATAVETFGAQNNGSFATFTDDGTSVGHDDTATFTVSKGNTITVTVGGTPAGTAYTISGTNENLSESLAYDSVSGGIQEWGATTPTP